MKFNISMNYKQESLNLTVSYLDKANHRLNMELGLQIYLGSMSRDVHSCTQWLRPPQSPLPTHSGSYTRALLVSQDRRHLCVTSEGALEE
jgi:hypothetical protein